jgi:hypothetical protein
MGFSFLSGWHDFDSKPSAPDTDIELGIQMQQHGLGKGQQKLDDRGNRIKLLIDAWKYSEYAKKQQG